MNEVKMAYIARYIDHTLLKLDATEAQIDQLCQEARTYNFKASRPQPLPAFNPR
jgi:deoxyribose-phosphate aldolase